MPPKKKSLAVKAQEKKKRELETPESRELQNNVLLAKPSAYVEGNGALKTHNGKQRKLK